MKPGEIRWYKPKGKRYKYYKPVGEKPEPNNIFVYLGWTGYQEKDDYIIKRQGQYYCPIGQHGHFGNSDGKDYLKKCCDEISKETYLKISKGIYTPKEYIQ